MSEQRCGNCKHWLEESEPTIGTCKAPIPFWVGDPKVAYRKTLKNTGAWCEAWQPKEPGK